MQTKAPRHGHRHSLAGKHHSLQPWIHTAVHLSSWTSSLMSAREGQHTSERDRARFVRPWWTQTSDVRGGWQSDKGSRGIHTSHCGACRAKKRKRKKKKNPIPVPIPTCTRKIWKLNWHLNATPMLLLFSQKLSVSGWPCQNANKPPFNCHWNSTTRRV